MVPGSLPSTLPSKEVITIGAEVKVTPKVIVLLKPVLVPSPVTNVHPFNIIALLRYIFDNESCSRTAVLTNFEAPGVIVI